MAKKPILGRSLLMIYHLTFVAVAAVPAAAFAQTPAGQSLLTEAQAVHRALARPALDDAIEGGVGVARAEAIRLGLWPNPEVSYSREQTDGPGGTVDDYVWISQQFDLSGRRGVRSEAAQLRARATRGDGAARRVRIAGEVRLRFYNVLLFQKMVATLQSWAGRLEAAAKTVSRREAAGDASVYDRRRLEREVANAHARLGARVAEREWAWSRLAVLVDDSRLEAGPWPRVSGKLLPDAPAARATFVQRIETRPDIRALHEVATAAALDGSAAGRWWVPELKLGGGWKSVDLGTDRIHGFLVVATATVPIFDRHQDEALRAQSEERRVRGERALIIARARGETNGLWEQATRLRETARDFRANQAAAATLVRMAEAGYRGGELGVLELLDAYRSAREDEQRATELELSARRARIELELISGGYVP